jgi:PadR family transcriptional regulator, regulatory protein PadR
MRDVARDVQRFVCTLLLTVIIPARMFPGNVPGKAMRDLDLLQGTLDVLVLKAVSWGPRHGYTVAQWIKETSSGALNVDDRALYVALHRLEERGWLASEWGLSDNNRRAKYYRLTAAGRRNLRAETDTWSAYAKAVFTVLRASKA